jgi:thiamine biosynthesis lipoprotein
MGGFLKGFVAEKMSDILKDFQGSIVNLGGDIFTRGCDEKNEKFIFSIFNPLDEEENFEISLENESISTSGNYKRK